jgi:hydroxymethylpyrimidine/phosphomethylpyrimidine kinase
MMMIYVFAILLYVYLYVHIYNNNMIKSPPKVMTFSATDPSGGAGLQADVLTISSLGCHPVSIATGFTVQDTIGVNKLISIDSEIVNDQARLILEDMEVEIFKLGVLGGKENIAAIAEIISDYPDTPLIIDPVLASGRGDEFADIEARNMMIDLLFPKSLLITPNSLEARARYWKVYYNWRQCV